MKLTAPCGQAARSIRVAPLLPCESGAAGAERPTRLTGRDLGFSNLNFRVMATDVECENCKGLLQRSSLDDCPTVKDLHDSADRCARCGVFWRGISQIHGKDQDLFQVFHERVAFEGNNGALRAVAGFSHDSVFKIDVEFYREAGETAWGDIKPGLPLSDHGSDSTASFDLIKAWLDDCDQKHRCLQSSNKISEPLLPTRVVDVGLPDGEEELRLLETHGKIRAQYIALSHCWGKKQIITTRKHNLPEHQQKIEWKLLSKTFQDAVIITRRLGIRFLWIDSLCIVQDDDQDWQLEASRMWSVYRSAYLVISATSAPDGGHGCFHDRRICVLEAQDRDSSDPVRILARKTTDHAPFTGHLAFGNDYPIFKRAWVMQERFLAARMIHYTQAELVWECMETFRCECGADISTRGASVRDSFKPTFASNFLKADYHSRINIWYRMIEEFTAKDITKESDRLPALSGIARHLQCDELGSYMAGMWSESLPACLCWAPVMVIGKSPQELHRRPQSYRAPSWSWAALEGDVQFHDLDEKSLQRSARVIDALCSPLGPDPYGQVEDGHLVLSALLMDATVGSPSITLGEFLDSGMAPLSEFYFLTKGDSWTYFLPDVLNDVPVGENVYYIPLIYSHRSWRGLVLKQSSRLPGAYERIGFVDPGSMRMIHGRSESLIRLV